MNSAMFIFIQQTVSPQSTNIHPALPSYHCSAFIHGQVLGKALKQATLFKWTVNGSDTKCCG